MENQTDNETNVNQTDNETNVNQTDNETNVKKENYKQDNFSQTNNNEIKTLTPIKQEYYKHEDNSCGLIFCCWGGYSSDNDDCCIILIIIALVLFAIAVIALIFWGIYELCDLGFVGQAIGVGLGSAFVGSATAIGTLFGIGAACLTAMPAIGFAALAITGFALAICRFNIFN